ncbi:MAG: CPBP family intramembrane metalloprotease [Anaerolineae bacterium]|nr:CPBP family intramembrane metalloprotease [Anaerolineae bacterium]
MVLRIGAYYMLMWFFTMSLGGLQQEAGLLPELTFLPQWGPGIAGLVTMLIFLKRDGVRISFFSREMPFRRYLWAFLLPLGFGLLALVAALLLFGDLQPLPLSTATIAMMIAGAIGEEIGWRGYLHKRIAPHLNGLWSSVIVGVLWASFHTPYYGGGLLYMVFFGLALVALSVMAYAVLAEYQFNVLGSTLFHLAINLTSALVAGLVLTLSLPFMVSYGVIGALLAAAVVYARRDLFFDPRAALRIAEA